MPPKPSWEVIRYGYAFYVGRNTGNGFEWYENPVANYWGAWAICCKLNQKEED